MKMKNIKIIDNKQKTLKSLNEIQIDDKNSSINNENQIKDTKNSIQPNDTSQDFIKNKKMKLIKCFDFPGFFFKKFNLTSYKKKRDDSRARSKSPERIYKLNHKKGNGIPDDLLERLKFLTKIVNNEKFQKYYNLRPKGKNATFEQISNYIINYYKTHNELEGLLMIYFFICNGIKYYSKETLEKIKEKYKNQTENNIFLDKQYFSEGYKPKIEEIFKKGIALSPSDYINIFEYFLKKLEIKYKHIDGYCKLFETKKEEKKILFNKKLKFKTTENYFSKTKSKSMTNLEELKLPEKIINHSWNAVFIKGEWYFVDSFFGAGGIIKDIPIIRPSVQKTKEKLMFNVYYFLTPPNYLILTHRPNEDYMQFLDKTVTFSQFYYKKLINYGDFYMGVFLNNVELISHKNPLIEVNVNEKLEIKIRQIDYVLEGDIYSLNLLNKVGEIRISYEDDKKMYILEPIFPGIGEYILRINSRPIISNDISYNNIFDYRIKVIKPINYLYFDKYKVAKNNIENDKLKEKRNDSLLLPKLSNSQIIMQPKIIQDYSKILPSKTNKKICYDNQDFYLIEPRTKILRKGIKFKFKIRIKGAISVSLLDGNHWTPMKKTEEDIYEGVKEIETDNVSICCLRNRNVYTEVIKFMIYKDRSILSKSVFPTVRKIKKNFIKSISNKGKNVTNKLV